MLFEDKYIDLGNTLSVYEGRTAIVVCRGESKVYFTHDARAIPGYMDRLKELTALQIELDSVNVSSLYKTVRKIITGE